MPGNILSKYVSGGILFDKIRGRNHSISTLVFSREQGNTSEVKLVEGSGTASGRNKQSSSAVVYNKK
jgi:hypothetical protein